MQTILRIGKSDIGAETLYNIEKILPIDKGVGKEPEWRVRANKVVIEKSGQTDELGRVIASLIEA